MLVGAKQRLPMRLLLLRVPKEVGDQRREDLLRDAQRRQQTVSEETLRLADWTILITDVPAKHLRFEEALVRLPRTLADGAVVQAVETGRPDRRVAHRQSVAGTVRTVCQVDWGPHPTLVNRPVRLAGPPTQLGQAGPGRA